MQPVGMQHEDSSSMQLQWWHYANLTGFIVQYAALLVVALGISGSSMNEEVEAVPTLLNPKNGSLPPLVAFLILFEGAFAVGQALPKYRGHKVSQAVCPWYLAACAFTLVWWLLFVSHQDVVALVASVGSFLSLLGAVWTIHATGRPTFLEYWVLRAGLGMRFGSSVFGLVFHMSVVAAKLKLTPGRQLTIAIGGLALALVVAVVSATALPKPTPWVPLFLAYSTFWVSQELENPKALLDTTGEFFVPWGGDVIEGLRGFCAILSVVCLVLGVVSMVLRFKDAPSSSEAVAEGRVDETVEFTEQKGESRTPPQQGPLA